MNPQAKWIWKKDFAGKDIYCDFYDSFDYQGGKVTLQISADSGYALYVNGVFADSGQYADYPHYKVYDEVDLTKFCKEGKNHIAIIVTHCGGDFFTYQPGKAALRYALLVAGCCVTASGEATLCRESRTYESGLCKIITAQLGYSFHYDITKEDGWMLGDLQGFENAAIVEQDLPMFSRPCKKLSWQENAPATLIKSENGTHFLYDLGREEVGHLTLKLHSSKKQKLLFAYGEYLMDGKVNRIIDSRDFSVEVTVKEGENVYFNPFRRLGLRYLEVFCQAPIEPEYITVKPAVYPLSKTENLPADPLDRKIYEVSMRTLELCMHEHYEDCPWREQSLYCMDSRNQMLLGYYAFQEYEFARANLKLMAMDRREDELLSICFPAGKFLTDKGLVIPSFNLHWFTQVWEYMDHSKDYAFGREIYPKLQSVLKVFTDRIEGGCVKSFTSMTYWNFYEWSENLEGHLGSSDQEAFEAALNCLMILALRNMARIAAAIGEPDAYTPLIAPMQAGIRKRFFDEDRCLFRNREDSPAVSELVNALCILANVATAEESTSIAQVIAEGKSGLTPATLSMLCFKYDALLKTDAEKYRAYIHEEIRAKYKRMLDAGATTFWETEDTDQIPEYSRCHGWSALPIYYFEVLKTGKHTSCLY